MIFYVANRVRVWVRIFSVFVTVVGFSNIMFCENRGHRWNPRWISKTYSECSREAEAENSEQYINKRNEILRPLAKAINTNINTCITTCRGQTPRKINYNNYYLRTAASRGQMHSNNSCTVTSLFRPIFLFLFFSTSNRQNGENIKNSWCLSPVVCFSSVSF